MLPPGKRIIPGCSLVIWLSNAGAVTICVIYRLALLPNRAGEIFVTVVDASTLTVALTLAGALASLNAGAVNRFAVHPSLKKPSVTAVAGSGGVTTVMTVSGLPVLSAGVEDFLPHAASEASIRQINVLSLIIFI